MVEIIFAVFCFICTLAFAFLAWQSIGQLEKQRKEWQEERSKLLDRIQSGSFAEYKAQERAEKPVIRKQKDPLLKSLESEPWL